MSEPGGSQVHVQEDSVTIFECLNSHIGYEKEIELRRCGKVKVDLIMTEQKRHFLYSGSSAEGFRLENSDEDIMLCLSDTKVVCDVNQINTQNGTNVLLMDTRHCRPGYSLLKVLSVINPYLIQCVTYDHDDFYLNASRYKEIVLSKGPNFQVHGPCCLWKTASGSVDFAFCIKCDYLPAQAFEFISRCVGQQWPPAKVLDEIASNGCHLVPVGAKLSKNEKQEWRISFSMAEKILIFTFNHTQFLCYGLLKLVLSQVINRNSNVSCLLCSYFFKTAVFWEIQDNKSTLWQPGNLLTCFWKCFDRLTSWVRSDYCPNFFIPENNMFFGKFSLKQQLDLLECLQTLRKEETGVFYKIPCLMYLKMVDGVVSVSPMHTRYIEYCVINTDQDVAVRTCTSYQLQSLFVKCLSYKQQITARAPAIVNDLLLDNIVKTLLFRELNDIVNSKELQNKDKYKRYRLRLYPYMRYLSSTYPGSKLYLATALYTLGRYNTVLDIVTTVQSMLHPVTSHYPILLDDHDLRKHLCPLILFYEEDQIKELMPELKSSKEKNRTLLITPLLYIKWLIFMCFHHKKDRGKCKQALEDLHVLLFDDRIDMFFGDMGLKYNMVGMCHEIYGDHQEALRIYRISVLKPGCFFSAAVYRLQQLENRLTQSS